MSPLFGRFASVLSISALLTAGAFAATNPTVNVRPQTRVLAKVDSKQLTVLHNTTPAVVASAVDNGRLATSTPLGHMQLVLKSSDDQEYALRSLIDQQQDKSSPNYHQWMTPENFAGTFGVSSADITTLTNWLQDQGFSVLQVSKGGRVIEFSGTSGQVESAFHTEMHTVTVDGVRHISNTVDVSVPQAFASVVAGVAKLNDFGVKAHAVNPHPVVKGTDGQFHPLIPGTNEPDYTSTSSGSHYVGPGDLATIYNGNTLLGTGINGKGQTIAVIGQTSINLADVQTYRSMFRLPDNDPQIINVGPPPATIGDDIESDLDLELAGALATQAKILFYTAGGSLEDGGVNTSALAAVDSNVSDIITLSYGGCEASNAASGTAFWNTLWEQAAAQGQTVFVSTGDSSATGCASSSAARATGSAAVYGVNALGSSAYNVAVGGSMFNEGTATGVTNYWTAGGIPPYSTAASYIPETVWSEGSFDIVAASTGVAGGGGGVSMFTGRPSWQVGSGIAAADPAGPTFTTAGAIPAGTPHRLVPDLAFIAAGNHDGTIFCSEGSCKLDSSGNVSGIGVVGGTSVATPAMAGVQALINQQNGGRQGNANYYYYALSAAQTGACTSTAPPASTCNFNDIVTGDNYSPLTANGYYNFTTMSNNGTKGTDYIGFAATAGYDEATGLGSPNITNLANNWKNVTFNSTTTKLTLSPTSAAHGTAIAATITVAATSGTPTGDVSITAVGQSAGAGDGTVYHLSAGSATASLTALPGGTYSVTAHYAGDGTFAPSTSAAVSVTITPEASTTNLATYNITTAGAVNAATSFAYGTSIYVDTEIVGASFTGYTPNGGVPNTGAPTGTVTYAVTSGSTTLAPYVSNLDAYGTTYLEIAQTFTNFLIYSNYPALSPATYGVKATYSGDSSFNTSNASGTFTVVKATVTPVIRAASAQIASGATATFNVSVAASGGGVLPTGTVTLTDTVTNGTTTTSTTLGTATLTNGAAVYTTNAITSAGSHSVNATYSGDVNYNAATSAYATLTVGGVPSAVVLTSTTPGKVLSSITFTATVAAGTTGTVYFYDGSAALGSSTISAATLTATLSTSILTAGAHTITAKYAGNTALQSSTSNALAITIAQNTPTISLTSQQANATGATVGMNAVLTLSPANNGVANPAPSAQVQYMDGTKSLGTASLAYTLNYHTYAAAFNTTALTPGPHALTAVYPGDTNYAAATSAVQNVAIGYTTTTITTNATTVNNIPTVGVNTLFNLRATIAAIVPNTPAIGGTVTFFDGTTNLGTATVTSGVGTLMNVSLSTAGTHNITAVYSGDANYYTSTSTTFIVNVVSGVGFTIVATPTSITVPRGGTGSTTITGTSFGNYNGAATLTCSGLPAGSFCTFNPQGIAFAGKNTVATSVMTVGALAASSSSRGTTGFSGLLWLPAVLLTGLFATKRKQFSKRGHQLMMLGILLFGMLAVSGCGSGGSSGTPTGTYSVVVSATATGNAQGSPNIAPSTTVSVTIQ